MFELYHLSSQDGSPACIRTLPYAQLLWICWIWHERKHFFHLKSSAPYLFLDLNSLFQVVCSFNILSITVPCLCTSFSTSEILQQFAGCHLEQVANGLCCVLYPKYVSVLFSAKWELLPLLQSMYGISLLPLPPGWQKWFLLLYCGWFTQPHFEHME